MTAVDLRAGVEALSSTPPSFLAHYSVEAGLELAQGRDETAIAAGDETCTVVFAGHLVDHERLGGPASAETQSTAELLLAAYRARGEAIFGDLRGVFAVVIHDRRRDTLLFARDQLGHHSLFFARESGAVHLSDSIVRLVRHPEVPSSIDRVVIAEMLIHRTRSSDETGFESVKRARSGWLYRLERSTLSAGRYWFPVAPDGATEWASEEELPEFEGLMAAAVRRSVEPGATGIFLSGGLDSVTVATYAADLLTADGEGLPPALSIMFPEFDETAVQTTVARTLGLPHTLVPFEEASGRDGLVMSAVRTSGTWPMPLVNLWQPAYAHLALLAKGMGIRRVLTGAGGDEWLQVSPQWGFSRLRRLHVREMHHLYRTYLQSYNLKRGPLLKNLLWRYGIRHTLRSAAMKSLDAALPKRRPGREDPPIPQFAAFLARSGSHHRGGGRAPSRLAHGHREPGRGLRQGQLPLPGESDRRDGAGGGVRARTPHGGGDVHALLGPRSGQLPRPGASASHEQGLLVERPGAHEARGEIS